MDLRDSYARQVKLLMVSSAACGEGILFRVERRHSNQFICAGFPPSIGGYRSGV